MTEVIRASGRKLTSTTVGKAATSTKGDSKSPFAAPRDYLGNRFVYVTISPRARGLSIGVNLNPDKRCNFDCTYCEVNRRDLVAPPRLDLSTLATELQATVSQVRSEALRRQPPYARMPSELLRLRHVAVSGDGEPTLSPQFREGIETVVHVRALSREEFFKIVLITNASNLTAPDVQEALALFTREDEIWAKLDAGTQAYMDRVNRPEVRLEQVLANILQLARRRPVVIQSLFPCLHGCGPDEAEVGQYVERLKELCGAGAQIAHVQIYSATRPIVNSDCGHLSFPALSRIAHTVRQRTGLKVEIF